MATGDWPARAPQALPFKVELRGTLSKNSTFPGSPALQGGELHFADFVISLTDSLPQVKHIRLIGQIESAAASLAQNIAEGKGRQYKKEFIQFLYIAEGSLFEALTLTVIFKRRDLFAEKDALEIRKRAELIDRKLHGLINSLRSRQ